MAKTPTTKKPATGRKKGYRPLKAPKGVAAPTVADELHRIGPDAGDGAGDPQKAAESTDNDPPIFDRLSMRIEEHFEEARNWLDGEPIANEDQATAVTALKGTLKELADLAEKSRKDEKEPHLTAGREVDAKWKPVIEMADKAVKVAQRALTPWLQAVEAENARKAEEARRAAAAEEQRLREMHEAARRSSDMADEDQIEQQEQAVKDAARAAREAAKAPAVVRTGAGKATLRTIWHVKANDHRALLNYYLTERPDVAQELREWLYERAQKDVRGGARVIPGCSIWDEKVAI